MGNVGWGGILRAFCIFWRRSRENRWNIRLALLDMPLTMENEGYFTFSTQRKYLRKVVWGFSQVPENSASFETGPAEIRAIFAVAGALVCYVMLCYVMLCMYTVFGFAPALEWD